MNSVSQAVIQKLFYRMRLEPEVGGELKAFMARAIENTIEDEKRLKNTPFAELPRKARAANKQIGALVGEYIANIESINRAKAACDREISSLAGNLEADARQFQEQAANRVAEAFATIAGIVLASGVVAMIFSAVGPPDRAIPPRDGIHAARHLGGRRRPDAAADRRRQR